MTGEAIVTGAAGLGLMLRATLLLGAAWAAAALLRKAGASAATRHMAWLFGMGALLALPLAWWLAPPLRLPILAPEEAPVALSALAPATSPAPPVPANAGDASEVVLVIYFIGVALLLLRLFLSRLLVARLWSDAKPALDPTWTGALFQVSRELRLSRRVGLRIARGAAMPMTWGTLSPKILLPAEALTWSPDRQRLVLLHELAHVARRDSLSRSAASLACALYWFHPGAWLAARQLRLEQEYAADDRVLMAGAPAHGYALGLLELARRVGDRSWPRHAVAMAGLCQLEQRVISITGTARRERPGPAFLTTAVLIAAMIMLAVAAGVPVRPLPALPASLQVETARHTVPGTAGFASDPPEARMQIVEATITPPRYEQATPTPRDDFRALRAAAAPQALASPAQEAQGQRLEPPPPVQVAPAAGAAGEGANGSSTSGQALAVYGPQLPRRAAAVQDFDPRIPVEFRGANPDLSAGRDGRNREPRVRSPAEEVLRVLPRIFLEASGVLPPRG